MNPRIHCYYLLSNNKTLQIAIWLQINLFFRVFFNAFKKSLKSIISLNF